MKKAAIAAILIHLTLHAYTQRRVKMGLLFGLNYPGAAEGTVFNGPQEIPDGNRSWQTGISLKKDRLIYTLLFIKQTHHFHSVAPDGYGKFNNGFIQVGLTYPVTARLTFNNNVFEFGLTGGVALNSVNLLTEKPKIERNTGFTYFTSVKQPLPLAPEVQLGVVFTLWKSVKDQLLIHFQLATSPFKSLKYSAEFLGSYEGKDFNKRGSVSLIYFLPPKKKKEKKFWEYKRH